jgi:hypothetical protein
MITSGPPNFLYELTTGLTCVLILIGFVAGIIAIVRKRTLPGSLATAVFAFLGMNSSLSLILTYVVQPALVKSSEDYGTYNWIGYCTNTPLYMLGILIIMILTFMIIVKNPEKSAPEGTPPAA